MAVPSAFFLNLRPRVVTKSFKKKLSFASVTHSPSLNPFPWHHCFCYTKSNIRGLVTLVHTLLHNCTYLPLSLFCRISFYSVDRTLDHTFGKYHLVTTVHCNVIINHTSNSLLVRDRGVVVLLSVHVVKIIRRIDKGKKKKRRQMSNSSFFRIYSRNRF